MGPVPDSLLINADSQLLCTDGKKLHCHSFELRIVSKVYADLFDSIGKAENGVPVDIRFNGCNGLGECFLEWVYHQNGSGLMTSNLNPDMVFEMATLGHYLDSPSEPNLCQQ
jgi:hypothetical protein